MKSAAVAALYGWDPLRFVALEEDDLRVGMHILKEQIRLEEERERARLDYLSDRVSQLTSGSILRGLIRITSSLFRRR